MVRRGEPLFLRTSEAQKGLLTVVGQRFQAIWPLFSEVDA